MNTHRPTRGAPGYQKSIGRAINKHSATCRKMKKTGTTPDGKIRIQLDAKTMITVNNLDRWDFWKSRYPEARILP